MQLYTRKDVDKKALKGARMAVLGYGSQGRAQALNLKDSGFKVVVGVRKGGASWKQAKRDGLNVAAADRGGGEAPTSWPCWCPTWRRRALYQRGQEPSSARTRRCCSRTASTSTSSRSSRARIWTWC